jgi:hypothetical protein
MSNLGAAAFSICTASAWVLFLVVKMNHSEVFGVIAVFVVGQLLLIALPECGQTGGQVAGSSAAKNDLAP